MSNLETSVRVTSLLDGGDHTLGNEAHVVPEALGSEGLLGKAPPSREGSVRIPGADLSLALGREGAVDSGQNKVLANRGTLVPLHDVSVDGLDELEPLGNTEKRGDRSGLANDGFLGTRGAGVFGSFDDGVGSAEVLLPDDAGCAVDALGADGIVIGVALLLLADNAGHGRLSCF